MNDFVQIVEVFATAGFWAAMLRIAVVYIFGAIGELVSERAGVMNLGIEGTMLLGALVAYITAVTSGSVWVGVLAAAATGAVTGALHAVVTVWLGLSQHVAGIALTLLYTGLAFFSFRIYTNGLDTPNPPSVEAFRPLSIPVLHQIPHVGPVLFEQPPLAYVAFLMVPVAAYVLYRTPLGLAVRSAGESPLATEAAGFRVQRIRFGAVIFGSALMGVAGAYLSTSYFNAFLPGIVNGRGWICVALVIFANWNPGKALAGALLFAATEALAVRVQALGIDVPQQVLLMLPYVATLLALVVVARRASYPSALLVPFRGGERT